MDSISFEYLEGLSWLVSNKVTKLRNVGTGMPRGCFLPLFLSPSCSNFLTVLRRNLKPIEEIKEKEASHGREKKEKAFKKGDSF